LALAAFAAHPGPMRDIPAELLARPFTPEQALDYGVTARQLEGRRCRQIVRGVHIGADVELTVPIMAQAVSLVLPEGCVVGGVDAAFLHRADVRPAGVHSVEVVSLRGSQIRRRGIRASEAFLEDGDVVVIEGVAVTSATRTAFDLGRRHRDLIERVVGLDAMLNRGGATLEELTAYIASHRHWRGVRWVDLALSHAEPLSESPMESRQRMRLVRGGLPRPRAQVPIELADRTRYRLDHGYEQWKVAAEYDGQDHEKTWRQDNERQELVRALAWWLRRFTSYSIQHGWGRMVNEVGSALVAAGWDPARP
jgi:very-short-patch-repair endonuclease